MLGTYVWPTAIWTYAISLGYGRRFLISWRSGRSGKTYTLELPAGAVTDTVVAFCDAWGEFGPCFRESPV